MARNSIIRETTPEVPDSTVQETPHGCYGGWIYMGAEVEDESGKHVEVIERVPCRRCNRESL